MACGAELQGVAVAGACPKCEYPVTDMLWAVSVDPATGTVDDDVECLGCGYSLRGRPVNGCCRDCDGDVHALLPRNELRCADPTWLQGVRRGIRGLMLLTAAFFVEWLIWEAVWRISANPPTAYHVGRYGVLILLNLPWLAAVFAVTRPEPILRVSARSQRARQTVRFSAIPAALLAVWADWSIVTVIWTRGFAQVADADFGDRVGQVVACGVLGACVGAVTFGALVVWLRQLAVRAIRPGLRDWLSGLLILVIVGSVFDVGDWILWASHERPSWHCWCCGRVVAPVVSLVDLLVLGMCSRMLTDTIRWQDQNTLANTP